MKIVNAHAFTYAEENLIKKAIYEYAKCMEDENGETKHLSPSKKTEYLNLIQIYHTF